MTAEAKPQANRADIAQHIERISHRWGELDIPVVLEVRMLRPGRTPNVARFDVSDQTWLNECIDHIIAMNEAGLNAYACVNPVNPASVKPGKNATDNDIAAAFFQWIDCDDEAATTAYSNFQGPQRAFNVLTGTEPYKRPHIYWELEAPATDLAEWRKVQIALAARFGSDGAVVNPSRIMRLAGTITYPDENKQAKGYVSETTTLGLKVQGPPVPFERMQALFPPVSKPAPGSSPVAPGAFQFDTGEDRGAAKRERLTAEVLADENYHQNVIPLTGSYVEMGLSDAEIHAIAATWNLPGYDAEANYREVQAGIDSARAKGFRRADEAAKRFDFDTSDNEEAGWKIRSLENFTAGYIAPDFLIESIVQKGRLYTMTGTTGTGKTTIMLHVSLCVATGRQVAGKDVEKGGVLYMIGENPDGTCGSFIAALDDMQLQAKGVNVHVVPGTMSIRNDLETLKREAAKIPDLSLIVVDTFAAYFDGDDENSNAQALDFARVVRALTELPSKPAVIMPAHPVKNASATNLVPKGGSSLLNEVDGNYALSKKGDAIQWHWQGKHRGPDFEPRLFEIETVETSAVHDSSGRLIPTPVARAIGELRAMEIASETLSKEDRVLLSIANDPAISMVERCTRLGLVGETGNAQKSSLQKIFDRLFKQKLIKRFRSNWELTGDGQKAVDMIREGHQLSPDLDQ